MIALFETIDMALNLYTWIIIASAVFSWLYAFNVINSSNRFVASLGEFLYKVTEPVLRPIRNILPQLSGIDISPVILLFIIFFIRRFMWTTLLPMVL
ncbi:YggT family protein [Paenochrobactrum glaciei]|uniref:YggT family protein n=1 Tax=Paenochrobactrum glaciei TaxID=486407 RepID=A0ABN1FUM7_9HYPH